MGIYKKRRDELENELNKGALWAITYGDLMSYLMIFFLILFSFSIAKTSTDKTRQYEETLSGMQKAFGGKASKKHIERSKAKEREDSVVLKLQEDKELSSLIQIQSTEHKIKLVLSEAVLFDSGKTDLKNKAKEIIKPIVQELKKLPNAMIVEGHTDNIPITRGYYRTNWELSMARAYSVIKYMEQLGMNPEKMAGMGYGEHRPITINTTAKGRAKNRRIEISLIKTE